MSTEYLWIWLTFKGEWDFYRDDYNSPKYMSESEAIKTYDSLFKLDITKRNKRI